MISLPLRGHGDPILYVHEDGAELKWHFPGPDRRYNSGVARVDVDSLPQFVRSVLAAMRHWVALRPRIPNDVQLSKQVDTEYGVMTVRFEPDTDEINWLEGTVSPAPSQWSGVVPFHDVDWGSDFTITLENIVQFRQFCIDAYNKAREFQQLHQLE